ncbi:MAG TPA: RDD family protein [Nocardioidaceae bacterium]|nr:RDD family protein [Nocardioidaceae bacterium]
MSDSTQNPRPEEPGQYPPGQGSYQPGMAPPPPMAGAPGVGQPADLMNRFLARLIDYVLLFVVNILVVTVVIVGALMGNSGSMMGSGSSFGASVVSSLLTAAIALGYFAFMESNRGQTVGKMLMKLETRGPGGGRPTMEEALKRNAFTAIGVIGIIPILGWILSPILMLVAVIAIAVTISNNAATRQGWHDQFAGGTSVVKIG